MKKTIFIAYESGHSENRDAILKGIEEYNKHQKTYKAKSWEFLKIGGQVLNATILKNIDDSDFFACDLTYHNHNVLFELGYAIGKNKSLFILLNPTVKNAKENYTSSRILKNIGYDEFSNSKDILRIFQKMHHIEEVSIDSIASVSEYDVNSIDFLFLSSSVRNQASLDLESLLLGPDYNVIHNNTSEIEYQTLIWYLNNIIKCKNIIIHLLGSHSINNDIHNAEYSLFAGLSCGLGKKVLLLAPKPFKAPIDYSDILIEYNDSDDCISKTISWINNSLISDKTADSKRLLQEKEYNLLKLGIGYETAEEEEHNLLEYFIEIDTYQNSLERSSSIITGRKGAGKSALFISLREYFKDKCKNGYNIFIKPESDELISNVEISDIFLNERTKRAFLFTVWKYVFYSNLFISIYKNLSKLASGIIDPNSIEDEILNKYNDFKDVLEIGPFSAMSKLYYTWNQSNDKNPEILEVIYQKILNPIIDLIKRYLESHYYTEINLLADNLDKTWDSKTDLRLQGELILSLLEFNGRIPKELDNLKIEPHTILILRTDIYDYILKMAREPDKIELKRLEVNWNNYPEKLKDLLEARFKFYLKINQDQNADHLWDDYFSLNEDIHPFDKIKSIIVFRPRDIIYFVSKLFESAVNKKHSAVLDDDFDYAIEAYSNFLYNNMISETKAQFPEVREIFSEIQSKFYLGFIEFNDFIKILSKYNYTEEKKRDLIDFLLNKNYLLAISDKYPQKIDSFLQIKELYEEKRFFVFKKNSIFLLIHPDRNRIKSYIRIPT